ncbi:MAG: hypothetical protein AAF732_23255, partial [Pseudomonadota bacterium]
VAPRPPQRGCSRVGHFTCREGGYAISMGPGRQAGTARERNTKDETQLRRATGSRTVTAT